MGKKISDLRNSIEELINNDISHSDLGSKNDFSEAEAHKNEICSYQIKILEEIGALKDDVPDSVLFDYLGQINNQFNSLSTQVSNIDSVISNGIHHQNYPNQRKQALQKFNNIHEGHIKNLFQIDKTIKLFSHDQIIRDSSTLDSAISTAKTKLTEINRLQAESEKALGDIRDISLVKSLKESAGSFDKLRSNHSAQEWNWMKAFITSFTLTLLSTLFVIFFQEIDTSSAAKTVAEIFKKLLLIGVPGLATKISLKKYNLERNLKIVYDHRATVLEQYKNFENAIGDDVDAKNTFRLEIAKYIFSDPQTGYTGDSKANEVSINPIVNFAEKMLSK